VGVLEADKAGSEILKAIHELCSMAAPTVAGVNDAQQRCDRPELQAAALRRLDELDLVSNIVVPEAVAGGVPGGGDQAGTLVLTQRRSAHRI
jgi:hypothetical protein